MTMSLFAKWLKLWALRRINLHLHVQEEAAPDAWKAFKHKGAPRGTPKAASLSRLRYRSKILPVTNRRTSSELAENAAKELESLTEYMPNL